MNEEGQTSRAGSRGAGRLRFLSGLDDSPRTAVTPLLWMYINLLIVNQAVLTFEASFTWREMFGGCYTEADWAGTGVLLRSFFELHAKFWFLIKKSNKKN